MKYQLTITIADDTLPVYLIDAIDESIETIACDTYAELYDAMQKLGINRSELKVNVYWSDV